MTNAACYLLFCIMATAKQPRLDCPKDSSVRTSIAKDKYSGLEGCYHCGVAWLEGRVPYLTTDVLKTVRAGGRETPFLSCAAIGLLTSYERECHGSAKIRANTGLGLPCGWEPETQPAFLSKLA